MVLSRRPLKLLEQTLEIRLRLRRLLPTTVVQRGAVPVVVLAVLVALAAVQLQQQELEVRQMQRPRPL
jgi:hypothetical protein